MATDEKMALMREVAEEIVTESELRALFDESERSGKQIVAYDGFEPSGQMHIAQALLRSITINKLTRAGIHFKMLVADWHALANNKFDGDMEKIRTTGEYFIEVWKACGLDVNNVEFVWGSDLTRDPDYWMLVVRIARTNGIRRFIRTAEIMGREESMDLTLAQLMYAAMQIADIFILKADIAQLGLDQRKVNMLAREVGTQLGYWKPISVSHHMLLGLGKPPAAESAGDKTGDSDTPMDAKTRAIQLKMSKSKPDTAIFVTDSREDIERKISKAWCPEGEVHENPVLEYFKYIVFEKHDAITIDRPEKFGGPLTFESYGELEAAYARKDIHPLDAKKALSEALDRLVEPIRTHFETDAHARDLLARVQSYTVTR